MGYRYYFGKISKKEGDILRQMKYPELLKKYGKGFEEDKYVTNHHLFEEIHEFGKYYDPAVEIIEKAKCFFLDLETHQKFNSEYDTWLVDKEVFLIVIEYCRKRVIDYYERLLKDDISKEYLQNEIKGNLREWKNQYGVLPYNLNLEQENIVDSWRYEYVVFELVRLYKTFDFEKNYLIFYAW